MLAEASDERAEKIGGCGYFIFSLSAQCAPLTMYDERLYVQPIVTGLIPPPVESTGHPRSNLDGDSGSP